ncbi:MAG: hypothetical protein NTW86_25185 [Candidatus Sumerlaeota bacterium]|nr:hypothetical protein [Candidatus Sumerlaeota bacterium]
MNAVILENAVQVDPQYSVDQAVLRRSYTPVPPDPKSPSQSIWEANWRPCDLGGSEASGDEKGGDAPSNRSIEPMATLQRTLDWNLARYYAFASPRTRDRLQSKFMEKYLGSLSVRLPDLEVEDVASMVLDFKVVNAICASCWKALRLPGNLTEDASLRSEITHIINSYVKRGSHAVQALPPVRSLQGLLMESLTRLDRVRNPKEVSAPQAKNTILFAVLLAFIRAVELERVREEENAGQY